MLCTDGFPPQKQGQGVHAVNSVTGAACRAMSSDQSQVFEAAQKSRLLRNSMSHIPEAGVRRGEKVSQGLNTSVLPHRVWDVTHLMKLLKVLNQPTVVETASTRCKPKGGECLLNRMNK